MGVLNVQRCKNKIINKIIFEKIFYTSDVLKPHAYGVVCCKSLVVEVSTAIFSVMNIHISV
jgi:hypothetical protein